MGGFEGEGWRVGTERMKERHQGEQRDIAENAGRRERRTQASGTMEQSNMDLRHGSVTLIVSLSYACLSHVGRLLMEPSYPG